MHNYSQSLCVKCSVWCSGSAQNSCSAFCTGMRVPVMCTLSWYLINHPVNSAWPSFWDRQNEYLQKLGNEQASHDAVAVYLWSHSVSWCLADGCTDETALPYGLAWLQKGHNLQQQWITLYFCCQPVCTKHNLQPLNNSVWHTNFLFRHRDCHKDDIQWQCAISQTYKII